MRPKYSDVRIYVYNNSKDMHMARIENTSTGEEIVTTPYQDMANLIKVIVEYLQRASEV